jgi:hypothetical protein
MLQVFGWLKGYGTGTRHSFFNNSSKGGDDGSKQVITP